MTLAIRLSAPETARACELAGMIVERVKVGYSLSDALEILRCGRDDVPPHVWDFAQARAERVQSKFLDRSTVNRQEKTR